MNPSIEGKRGISIISISNISTYYIYRHNKKNHIRRNLHLLDIVKDITRQNNNFPNLYKVIAENPLEIRENDF